MTLISSGQLALQDAGTNPSSTTTNKLYDQTMTSGVDALLGFQRLYELSGGDNFATYTEWMGDHYGYNNSFFTSVTAGNPVMGFLGNAGPTGAFPAGNFRAFSNSNIGSLGQTTFSDGGGTTRTIKAISWGQPDGAPSPNNNVEWFIFALSGTGISNTDNTFKSIKITKPSGSQQTFTRSNATRYSSSDNGSTAWAWEYSGSGTQVDNLGTSGTGWDVEIYGSDVTTTLNNGIAEEMGGADSADVKMSDYYSNGTFIGTISGHPESGEIKFSDFYGLTHQGLELVSGTMTNYYSAGSQYIPAYSGYVEALSQGSWNGASFTFDGDTCVVSDMRNFGGQMYLTFRRSDNSTGVFSNSGWTSLKIYLNQTNNSGSPDLTLARTSATFTTASNVSSATWQWGTTNTYSLSTYFGTSSGNQHYIEVV